MHTKKSVTKKIRTFMVFALSASAWLGLQSPWTLAEKPRELFGIISFRNCEECSIKVGDILLQGDVVFTHHDEIVEVTTTQGTQIRFAPSSRAVLGSPVKKDEISLLEGALFAKAPDTSHSEVASGLNIKTLFVEFQLSSAQREAVVWASMEKSQVLSLGDAILVKHPDLAEGVVRLAPGHFTELSYNQRTLLPRSPRQVDLDSAQVLFESLRLPFPNILREVARQEQARVERSLASVAKAKAVKPVVVDDVGRRMTSDEERMAKEASEKRARELDEARKELELRLQARLEGRDYESIIAERQRRADTEKKRALAEKQKATVHLRERERALQDAVSGKRAIATTESPHNGSRAPASVSPQKKNNERNHGTNIIDRLINGEE